MIRVDHLQWCLQQKCVFCGTTVLQDSEVIVCPLAPTPTHSQQHFSLYPASQAMEMASFHGKHIGVLYKPWSHDNTLFVRVYPLARHAIGTLSTLSSFPLFLFLELPPPHPDTQGLPFCPPHSSNCRSESIQAQAFINLEPLQDQGHGSESRWQGKMCLKQ